MAISLAGAGVGLVVLGVHRVHRDPHELRPHHLVVREGRVELGRVEAGQPVP